MSGPGSCPCAGANLRRTSSWVSPGTAIPFGKCSSASRYSRLAMACSPCSGARMIPSAPMPLPLLSVVHVNVNCSDLARSLAFYRDQVGLAPLSHTAPGPQDGAGFALAGKVRWDAWLLHDARGQAGPALDLL